ncbi:MAG TPA: hypothetical protein VHA12_01070 [Candidatus Nanoarchaeia archaeon]|nr:hypothetical protein [Candidatus Nanoarchaeia archaeon]
MSIALKHKIALTIIILVTVLTIVYFQLPQPKTSTGNIAKEGAYNSVSLTSITYNNLPSELSSNAMIKALPKDSTILLKFYNFNTGERQWERSFTLTKGKVTQGGTEGDIVLSLHSKYLSGLTTMNLCSVIQKANKAGDLGFETDLSKTALLWKFKSVLEYKSCFGL